MCRAFLSDSIAVSELNELLDTARRAPSAGHTHGIEFLVLASEAERQRYWATTLPSERRAEFAWPGLLDAPVLVLLLVRPAAWVDRYGEPDKRHSGLGVDAADWPVPYWWFDAGTVAQNLLLLAEDAGLGALAFGLFGNERAVLDRFDVPATFRCPAVIALGRPAGERTPSASVRRHPRPPLEAVVHYDGWAGPDLHSTPGEGEG
jgi:nitroreductase